MNSFDQYVKTVNHETSKYRFEIHIGKPSDGGWRAYVVGEDKSTGQKTKVGTTEVPQEMTIDQLVELTIKELDSLQ